MTVRDLCKLYRLDPLEKIKDNRLPCFKFFGVNEPDPRHAVLELMYFEGISRFADPESGIFTGFGISQLDLETNYRKMLIINENGTSFYTRKHAYGQDDGLAEYMRGCVYRLFCEVDLAELEQI